MLRPVMSWAAKMPRLANLWAAKMPRAASGQLGLDRRALFFSVFNSDFDCGGGEDVPLQNGWTPVRKSLRSGTEHPRLLRN